jgi:ABC-2 type transport system permease protein
LFWWSIILLVNSWRISAATAGLTLAAIWAVLVLVAPALILAAAQTLNQAPSRFGQIAAARASEIASTSAYENDHPELGDDSLAAQRASARKSASISTSIDAAVAPLSAEFDARLAAQQRLVRQAQLISPPLVASDALTAIAGTDGATYAAFRDCALAYRRVVKRSLETFVTREAAVTPADLSALPRFSAPDTGTVPTIPFAMLLVVTLALASVALRRLRRVRLA